MMTVLIFLVIFLTITNAISVYLLIEQEQLRCFANQVICEYHALTNRVPILAKDAKALWRKASSVLS